MKKEILILCKTDLQRDPRVLKQIKALHLEYNLTCVGVGKSMRPEVQTDLNLFKLDGRDSSLNRVTHITKLITKQYKSLYWTANNTSVYNRLKKNTYHLIICNETESLPIAHRLAAEKDTCIYCDLHEYYLDDHQTGSFSNAQQQYEKWILTNHIDRVKHFTTVSPQIIRLYKEGFNIDCSLLDNACKYYDLLPRPMARDAIRIISHGAAIPTRRLELMIDAVTSLDSRYTLDLYLMNNNPAYKQYLEQLVENNSQVSVLEPIPFNEIQETINQYDIGLYLLFPTHLNNANALPNKLFEFIQGRVAIIVGPTPGMADIVKLYDIGVVADNFTSEAIAQKIKLLTIEDIKRYKSNTNTAAKERNSSKNIIQIKKIVAEILSKSVK